MGITEEAQISDITQQLSDTGKSREVLFNSSSSYVYMCNISLFQTILMRDSNFAFNTDATLSDRIRIIHSDMRRVVKFSRDIRKKALLSTRVVNGCHCRSMSSEYFSSARRLAVLYRFDFRPLSQLCFFSLIYLL